MKPMLAAGHRFAVGFALGSAVLAGYGLAAQGFASHNSRAPVNFAADRIQLQDREKRVILAGNVDITQADLTLRAARTVINYTDAGSLEVQRITATGGVTVSRGNETARGSVGVYDFNRRIITLSGDVRLRRGTDTLNGGRLVIDLRSGVSTVDGRAGSGAAGGTVGEGVRTGGGGRVSGTFTVPQN